DLLTTVVPNSYDLVESNPTNLMDFFSSIPLGLIDTADIVFLVLIIGGTIAVFDSTGATFSGINTLVEKTKDRKYLLIISVLTVLDRKSTRLNSSHVSISYVVFCLKKKSDN